MKIRTGFVSNSSSSSFCIFGTEIEDKKYEEIEDIIISNREKYAFIEVQFGPEGDDFCYLGRSLTTIKDDETGASFKESTSNKITEILGKETKCSIIEMGWYDG